MENPFFRLIPADPSLAKAVSRYYQKNRDFLSGVEPLREAAFFTEEFQRDLLAKEALNRHEKTGFRFYLVPAGEPETVIGCIGLSNVIWGAFRSAFLGYKMDRDYCGRGYMTMAVSMMVSYAFDELELHRIEANVMPKNAASLRVLEKNGFVCEGCSQSYLKINGKWEDHLHMVRLNEKMV